MKNKTLKFSLLFLTFISISACSSDDDNSNRDTEKPKISIIKPTDHGEFLPGESLEFIADFSDNDALVSYKIEIHSASDDHHHDKNANNQNADWFYTEVHQLEANTKEIQVQSIIQIPVEINGNPIQEGHYHLGVYLIDRSGNEQQQFVEVAIGDHHHD